MVSWLAAMLTDTISMPTDGPFVTADNDAAGKSPVNIGLKDMANMITGLAGSLIGNIAGAASEDVFPSSPRTRPYARPVASETSTPFFWYLAMGYP